MLRIERRARRVLGAVGLLLAGGLVGCSHAGAEADSRKGAKGPKAVPVTVAPLERRTVERTVDVVGTLRGWEQVTVGTKRTGRVLRVLHDMGDRVRPGEPLVELDPVDARLAHDQAQTRYLAELVRLDITTEQADAFIRRYGVSEELIRGKHAEEAIERVPAVIQVRVSRERALQNLNRQRALKVRGASTAQELEDYENEHRSAIAAYDNAKATARNVVAMALANRVARDQARQALEDMTIRAPSPKLEPSGSYRAGALGYAVTRRSVSEGQMIREGETVLELVIEDPLRLWASVPERHSEEIRAGQPVRIAVSAHPGKVFEGKVVRINPSVDPTTRTFQVEAQVPNGRGVLRPGSFAKATIVTDAAGRAAVVPVESVVQFAGVTKLFVVEGGKARAINEIVTGQEGRGWVEVRGEGLPEKADVVVTGQSQLADGTPVIVRQPEPPSGPGKGPEPTPGTTVAPGPADPA